MKKQVLLSLSLLTLSLSGCNSLKNNYLNVTGSNDSNIKELARQTVLGFSSLYNLSSSVKAKRDLLDNEIEEVKLALNEVDLLLNNDSKLVVKEKASDKEEFLKSIDLSFSMFNKNEKFTLYYNEVEIKEEKDDDDFDEVEIEKVFKGIALYNDLEYDFRFSMEEEKDLNESEAESTFTLFFNKDDYIVIKQSIEEELNENESSYTYKLVQDKRTIDEFKFKQEVENGKLHVDLIKNDRRYKINYETVNNEELIRVALKVNKEETAVGYFKKVVNDTNVSYEYVH